MCTRNSDNCVDHPIRLVSSFAFDDGELISTDFFLPFSWQMMARQLYPKTIRAKFGVNKVQNAIHCTDLEEDCKLEVEYFFKILSSR